MFNLGDIFTKKYLKEYCDRNKKFFIISVIIFVASIVIGAIFSENFETFANEIIRQMLNEISMNSISEGALDLFLNNITASIIMLLSGLLFSIFSVFAMILNGILIGYVFTLIDPVVFFVGTLPHGIFELTALMLSLTGAFILTKIEIKVIKALFRKNLKSEMENIKIDLKDVLFTFIVSFVLIVIAAIIEAAITPVLINIVI